MNKEKRTNVLKCILVIFVVVLPNIFRSITMLLKGDQGNIFFNYYTFNLGIYSAIFWLIMSLQFAFPVLLVVLISNEIFKDYGFNKINIKDTARALLRLFFMLLGFLAIYGIINLCIKSLFFKDLTYNIIEEMVFKEKISIKMFLINILPIILISFTEEICFRSYLYTNLNKIIEAKWICIFITNLLFSSYHIYQGITGVIYAFIFGLACSIEYKNYKNIYTIGIFHALGNIITFTIRIM